MSKTIEEKAIAVIRSLETGDPDAVSYINPEKYIQHNLGVKDGLAGFGELLKLKPEEGFKARVVRSFSDGDYVILHTEYDFFGPKVGFDIFRFEDGLIVEHWDNLSEIMPKNPSGRTQIDGETQVSDLEKTESNKKLITSFYNDVLIGGKSDKMKDYFNGDNYINHNPRIGDKLSGIFNAMEEFKKTGFSMGVKKLEKVFGRGNFILGVAEGDLNGNLASFYDLFRIENGKLAEHWDIVEVIPPKEKWQNSNGKFNFK